jgi:hypothetical protein
MRGRGKGIPIGGFTARERRARALFSILIPCIEIINSSTSFEK